MRYLGSTTICIATAMTLFLTCLFAVSNVPAQAQGTEPKTYWTLPDDIPLPTVVRPEISSTLSLSDTPPLADGYLFLSPHERRVGRSPYDPTLLIIDNNGDVVYHRQIDDVPDHTRFDDFKVLDNGLLVSWVGAFRRHQFQDSAYNIAGTVNAVGNRSDLHDIVLLPNGNYMLLIYSGRTVDVSDLIEGGATDLGYIDCNLQEINSEGEVVFEWLSNEHFAITDTYNSLLSGSIDGPHCNSIHLDNDGNLLLSSRDHYEVTKINKQTGEIVWRLGGKNNQFEFINAIDADDVLFEKQHDARRVDNGNLTLFDNRKSEYSRAVEYELDEENMTATLVWEHRETPDTHGAILGNTQRLSNGNTLISWGNARKTLTEVTRDGTTLLELYLPPEMVTYRSYRYPWVGQPTAPPDLVVVREVITSGNTISDTTSNRLESNALESIDALAITTSTLSLQLAYSWNGDTKAAGFHVYGDATSFPETLIATENKTGFETMTIITDSNLITAAMQMDYNFRVVPFDASGLPFTKTSTVTQSSLISSVVKNILDAIIITPTPSPTSTATTLPTVQPTSSTPVITATLQPTPTLMTTPMTTPTPTIILPTPTPSPPSATPTPIPPSATPLSTPTSTTVPKLTATAEVTETHKIFVPGLLQQP